MGEPSPQKPPEPAEEPMQFDVSITINKARGLPLPPLFYSNPIVECLWGEPDPALLGSSSRDLTPTPVRSAAAGSSAAGPSLTAAPPLAAGGAASELHAGPGSMLQAP